MDLAYKSIPFQVEEIKDRSDGWSFTGYASTFGNTDLGGDVVLKGAFRESLSARKPRLLWQHDMGEPIGVVTGLVEDQKGLHGEFKLSKTARGSDAYQLLKDGAVDSLSIGYVASDVEFKDDGTRELKSVDLLEVSIVSLPMNEMALVTAVKQRLPLTEHVDRVLEDVRLVTARCKQLASLRAEDKRPAGETVRRFTAELPTELKALAAEVEAILAAVPEVVPPTVSSRGGTSTRLEIARRRLALLGA